MRVPDIRPRLLVRPESSAIIVTSMLRYLSHPQVEIVPHLPVPKWGLSEIGRRRTLSVRHADALRATCRIVSSTETKAIETASILAGALGLELETRAAMHENDRSATGFLEPAEFEAVADRFFAEPGKSVRGWERAIDAQARIVREVETVLAVDQGSDVLIVGHGGVGTLLYCHFAGLPISRDHDQPSGGGNFFAVDCESCKVRHPWRPMEEL